MIFKANCLLALIALVSSEEAIQPNIVFIVADDLGWDDVSFHGSDQILTPNIDILAYEGVILNQYYTDTEGTASSSSLFTGKYAIRLVKGCLFNITADPLEMNDLWNIAPELMRHMTLRLRTLWVEMVPRRQPQIDPKANPSLRNYTWSPWVANNEKIPDPPKTAIFPLQISVEELQYLVDLNFNTFRENLNLYIKNMSKSFVRSVSELFSF